jgi:integrase
MTTRGSWWRRLSRAAHAGVSWPSCASATSTSRPACSPSAAPSSSWFRTAIWLPALKAADLQIHVRMHDLRHAHASWLLAGGADLQVVRQRLGHSSLRTTERYLHTLPDADETALDALAKIRSRATQS